MTATQNEQSDANKMEMLRPKNFGYVDFESVVEQINDADSDGVIGMDYYTPEFLAASYATDCDDPMSDDDYDDYINGNLDYLIEEGAIFDKEKALKCVERIKLWYKQFK